MEVRGKGEKREGGQWNWRGSEVRDPGESRREGKRSVEEERD